MPTATTLRDLLRIREYNEDLLRKSPGYLGSAVGHKYRETASEGSKWPLGKDGKGIPVVMLFVDAKLARDDPHLLPRYLTGPDNLSCETDVVTGAPLEKVPVTSPALTGINAQLVRQLREGPVPIMGGIPLSSNSAEGTAACVTRRRNDGALCILTNWHVVGPNGGRIIQPPPGVRPIGITDSSTEPGGTKSAAPTELVTVASFSLKANYRMDAALVRLYPGAESEVKPGVYPGGTLGQATPVQYNSMDMIGRRVVGVGRSLGSQKGTIVGYGYQWLTDPARDNHEITDYLILGDEGRPFAAPGDSGKLVVTDDDERIPVALLWGAHQQQFWTAKAQHTWDYATALYPILETLEVNLYTGPESKTLSLPRSISPEPDSTAMNPSYLTLRYLDPANTDETWTKLEAHDNGAVAVHTSKQPDRLPQHLFSIVQGGNHELYTLEPLDLRHLNGTCTIAQAGGPPKPLNAGTLLIERGAFTIAANGFTQILGTPRPGPGMSVGSPGREISSV